MTDDDEHHSSAESDLPTADADAEAPFGFAWIDLDRLGWTIQGPRLQTVKTNKQF